MLEGLIQALDLDISSPSYEAGQPIVGLMSPHSDLFDAYGV